MSRVYQCDKCKRIFEPRMLKGGEPYIARKGRTDLDLCPKCYELLMDFLKDYDTEAEDRVKQVKIVYCKKCVHRDPEDKKCDFGMLERAGCIFPVADNYYCAYGKEAEDD